MDRMTPEHAPSSGNVFADLVSPNAEESQAEAVLVHRIASIVAHRHFTQTEVGEILGRSQPKVSDLLAGRLHGFSVNRLIRYPNVLDQDVRIVLNPKSRARARASLKVTRKSRALGVHEDFAVIGSAVLADIVNLPDPLPRAMFATTAHGL